MDYSCVAARFVPQVGLLVWIEAAGFLINAALLANSGGRGRGAPPAGACQVSIHPLVTPKAHCSARLTHRAPHSHPTGAYGNGHTLWLISQPFMSEIWRIHLAELQYVALLASLNMK